MATRRRPVRLRTVLFPVTKRAELKAVPFGNRGLERLSLRTNRLRRHRKLAAEAGYPKRNIPHNPRTHPRRSGTCTQGLDGQGRPLFRRFAVSCYGLGTTVAHATAKVDHVSQIVLRPRMTEFGQVAEFNEGCCMMAPAIYHDPQIEICCGEIGNNRYESHCQVGPEWQQLSSFHSVLEIQPNHVPASPPANPQAKRQASILSAARPAL